MKPLGWIGSAKEDLLAFPPELVREVGHVLYSAQLGGMHHAAKPLKGFGGAGVLEVVESHDGDMDKIRTRLKWAEEEYAS